MPQKTSAKIKLLIIPVFIAGFFLNFESSLARENITDWYIQNFESEIIVNKDSSLDITERITADCGNLPGKHGIFRILPEAVNIEGGGSIKSPVKLISITDFDGEKINYTESRSYSDGTVTWKIGDADKTVSGVNYYLIRYKVENAIRFGDPDFDEFYWNLNGNFWDLETDKFHVKIIFPQEVNESNSQVDYYTGNLGSKSKDLASFSWSAPNVLEFESTKALAKRQGITASVIFSKNIFTPYQPGLWERFGKYFALPVPLVVFIFCFYLWGKYGRDPRVDKTIIAEYDIPENLTPIELGMVMSNGTFSNDLITAEVVNLAAKGLMTIKETSSKVLFFNLKDYELEKKPNEQKEQALNEPQKKILEKIFKDGNIVKLSDLKSSFYTILDDVEKKSRKILENKNLLTKKGFQLSSAFVILGIILAISSFFLLVFLELFSGYFAASFFLSAAIIFIFGLIMPKRTPAGAELNWQIKGFKLFMETVDKYRAEFYEKEYIFEKFLPYAIVFGITEIWIEKMKQIYGDDFYSKNAPAWYVGTNVSSFDAKSFSTAISSLSSSIAQNTSSPSGSGGGGGAGGGGGGGGGGGW